jgi:hypothetical protein
VIATAVGLLAGLLAHQLGIAIVLLGLGLVVVAALLTMTVIGAVIGIPLLFVGAVGIVFGAASANGALPATLLGVVVGLVTYLRLSSRDERAVAR